LGERQIGLILDFMKCFLRFHAKWKLIFLPLPLVELLTS
jgi:hypothetical protein